MKECYWHKAFLSSIKLTHCLKDGNANTDMLFRQIENLNHSFSYVNNNSNLHDRFFVSVSLRSVSLQNNKNKMFKQALLYFSYSFKCKFQFSDVIGQHAWCWHCDTPEAWLGRLAGFKQEALGSVAKTHTSMSLLCRVCLHNRWRMECCHIYKFIVLSCRGTSRPERSGAFRASFWISPGHPTQQWFLKLIWSFGKSSIEFMGT